MAKVRSDAVYEAEIAERFEQGEMDYWEAEDLAVFARINAAVCKVLDQDIAEMGITIINPV